MSFGETTLAQRLSMVGGVAQVLVYGAQKYAVRVQLDPSQLATRGIALEDVATAVSSQNVNLPTGVLWGPKTALTVQATGQLDNAGAFRRHHRRLSERRAGPSERAWPHHGRRAEQQDGELVQRRSGRSSSRSSGSRARTRSTSPTA